MVKRWIPLLALSAVARAGPPMRTDDPDTTPAGHWEINLALTTGKRSDIWSSEAPLLDMSYGLADRVELDFTLPYVLETREGHGTWSGMGDAEFGAKWKFFDLKEPGIMAAVSPDFGFNTSSSAARRGLVPAGWEFLLPVEAQWEFAPGNLVIGEAGYVWREHGGNGLEGGVALSHEFTKKFTLLGELHATSTSDFRQTELVANLGGQWQVTTTTALLAAIGHGLTAGAGPRPEVLGYLGVQWTF